MSQGLDDVIAAETQLSDVDGEAGRLVIRGHALETLVALGPFERAAALLLEGLVEPALDAAALPPALGRAREAVFAHVSALDASLLRLPPFDAMRALMARLDDGEDGELALSLIAAPAVFLPAILRRRAGLAPVPPRKDHGHADDMLFMMTGQPAEPSSVAGLDIYLKTICDHGLNASTFASRVVASTGAGLTSSLLAAMSALKGPLHGGAPGPVLDMLDAIGTAENAQAWLTAAVLRGERLMGFGHRIYRVRDPRADALKTALAPLAAQGGGRLALAEAVEAAALDVLKSLKPNRPLDVNVEFYTALLLDRLGFPRDAFTAVFAAGRSIGWIAHAREQSLQGRLIRPRSLYVGPLPQAA